MAATRRQKLVVPDVTGLHWENAAIQLRNEGFGVHRVHYTEAYDPIDTVVAQSPLKGQIASSDDVVVLHVSKRSLVRFLPSIYQTTGAGTDPEFVRNFLWIFHTLSDTVSRRVDRVHRQFSPYSADEEFLPWLAQWVSITLDADWPPVKKRQMIRSAAELFQWRGTSAAIRRLLEIFTDVTPEIVENQWPYDGFWVGVHSSVGIDTIVLPPVNLAHCFIVRFPRRYEQLGEELVARVHQIIQAEKPAHSVYFLEFEPERVAGDGEAPEGEGEPGFAAGAPSSFAAAGADGGTAAGGEGGPAGGSESPGDAGSAGLPGGAAAAPGTGGGAAVSGAAEPGSTSAEETSDAPAMPMGIGVAAAIAEGGAGGEAAGEVPLADAAPGAPAAESDDAADASEGDEASEEAEAGTSKDKGKTGKGKGKSRRKKKG